MKKQAIVFGLLGASVLALGFAHRKHKAVPPMAEQAGVALLGKAQSGLIRAIALRDLAKIGAVWAAGWLCKRMIPQSAE